jgi:hypothetical protein
MNIDLSIFRGYFALKRIDLSIFGGSHQDPLCCLAIGKQSSKWFYLQVIKQRNSYFASNVVCPAPDTLGG